MRWLALSFAFALKRTKAHTFASHTSQARKPKLAKECAFFQPNKKLKNKKFSVLQKNKTSPTHSANLTRTSNECKSLRGQFRADIGGHRFGRKEPHAHNKKINANFLFGGFIASYESLCVIKQLCFVSTVVRKLPQIKNFVYP